MYELLGDERSPAELRTDSSGALVVCGPSQPVELSALAQQGLVQLTPFATGPDAVAGLIWTPAIFHLAEVDQVLASQS